MRSLKQLLAFISIGSLVSFALANDGESGTQTSTAAEGEPTPGLVIDVTHSVENCSRRTKKGDTLEIHYRGTLASDGSKFDASYDRGTPFVFTIGKGMVIKGWDQGLLDMCVGEKRKLTIPPHLAYGDRAMGGKIPAKSTLIFETELIGIKGGKDEL